ncbi:hypothetical protein ACS0TY_017744 [Phlomoides rotata]
MLALNHYIYIIDGVLCPSTAEHIDEDQESVVPYVRRYNIGTDTWETCAPMSTPRTNFACSVSDNKIYVAGGQCTSGRAEGLSSTEVYNPTVDRWTSLANMTVARYNCVGITWKGRIHVVGGFVSGRLYANVVARSSAEVYDENRDQWDVVPRMRDFDTPPNQIVTVNQMLFSSGDYLRRWKGYIEVYDENEKIWIDVQGSNFNFTMRNMVYLTMAPIGNQLYFLAGYRMLGEDSRLRLEVHAFDTSTNSVGWRSFDPMEDEGEKELCGHCCVLP